MRNSEDFIEVTVEIPVTFDIPLEDLIDGEWMEEISAEEILDFIKADFKSPQAFIREMYLMDRAELYFAYNKTDAYW